MSIHDAILPVINSVVNYRKEIVDNSTPELNIHSFLLAEISKQSPVDTSKTLSAILPTGAFTDEVILGKTYFTPRLIESGFITEDSEHSILIWNSAQTSKEISSIAGESITGTELVHDSTPININSESDVTHTLSVLKEGPPFQSSEYTYTIDGLFFVLLVTGQRIEPFLFDPDWSQSYKCSYSFNTVLSRTKKFVEQRRPLLESARREIECGFWEQGLVMQRVHNELKRFNSIAIGVPIFQEILELTSNPQDELTATFRQDLSPFFNLNNSTTFLLIKDLQNIDNHEVKEISSIDLENNEITFTNTVKNSYTPSQCIVYPIFIGQTESFQPEYLTDQHAKFTLKFIELKL